MNMIELFSIFGGLLVIIILAHMYYSSKKHTIDQICNHPELSDEKVESITKMMKRQYKDHVK